MSIPPDHRRSIFMLLPLGRIFTAYLLLLNIIYAHAVIVEHIIFKCFNPYNPGHPDHIELLRPEGYAYQHGLMKNASHLWQGRICTARVTVTAVDKGQTVQNKQNNQYAPVTGIYIHQAKNVKTWRFMDENRHITTLNATDNHPFYVKELHRFLPIKKITQNMSLSAGQHQLHLLCDSKTGCGKPFHSAKPVYVYNIEVKKQHVYHVGEEKILVHNCALDEEPTLPQPENPPPLRSSLSRSHSRFRFRFPFRRPASKQPKFADMLTIYSNPLSKQEMQGAPTKELESIGMQSWVEHPGDSSQVFSIAIGDNLWEINDIPEDFMSNQEYYLQSIHTSLDHMATQIPRYYFHPEIIKIDFGNEFVPGFDNFFKTEEGGFFQKFLGYPHNTDGVQPRENDNDGPGPFIYNRLGRQVTIYLVPDLKNK